MTTSRKRPAPPPKAQAKTASKGAAKDSAGRGKTTPSNQAKAAASGTAKPPARRGGPQPAPKKKFPVLPVVFVGVAAALVAAIVLSSDTPINSGDEFGEPEITGEALPTFAGAGAADPAVGMTVPAVTGEDFDGGTVSIDPTDGTPRAILFLAHWCPHCRAEVPRVQQWLDSGGGVEGVEIVSVATSITSSRENYPPSEWLEAENWTPPVIRDDTGSSVYTSYGQGGFPYYVFMDADGNVVRRSSGELDIATLESYMQEIAP